jgi:uncharacterized protein YkwD
MAVRGLKRALVVVAVAVTIGGVSVSADGSDDGSSAAAMVARERRSADVPPVDISLAASRVAARHSARMARAGRVFHNNALDRESTSAGVEWDVIAENVGTGASVEQVHDGFVASASHHYNLVDARYDLLGMGIVHTGDGLVYVTQIFAHATETPVPLKTRSSTGSRTVGACESSLTAEDGSTVAASFYDARCS